MGKLTIFVDSPKNTGVFRLVMGMVDKLASRAKSHVYDIIYTYSP